MFIRRCVQISQSSTYHFPVYLTFERQAPVSRNWAPEYKWRKRNFLFRLQDWRNKMQVLIFQLIIVFLIKIYLGWQKKKILVGSKYVLNISRGENDTRIWVVALSHDTTGQSYSLEVSPEMSKFKVNIFKVHIQLYVSILTLWIQVITVGMEIKPITDHMHEPYSIVNVKTLCISDQSLEDYRNSKLKVKDSNPLNYRCEIVLYHNFISDFWDYWIRTS